MTKFEVGFYYRVTVHVEAKTESDAMENARNMDLDVSVFSANDPNASADFVECIDPDITAIGG